MALELSDVKRLAHLARIEVSETEAAHTLTQLNQFFSMVAQIQAVETDGIAPMTHPIELAQAQTQRLREDAATEPDRRADYQQCAPATEAGLYLVPKVIE